MILTLAIESLCEIEKSWVDDLSGFLKDFDQVIRFCRVVACEERVRCASLLASSCSSDSVDIIFRIVWIIVIDHPLNVVDIFIERIRNSFGLRKIETNFQTMFSIFQFQLDFLFDLLKEREILMLKAESTSVESCLKTSRTNLERFGLVKLYLGN